MKKLLLKTTKLENGYEKLEYHDKVFYNSFVKKDDWWELTDLPADHHGLSLEFFIKQLQAYSEEKNNPAAVSFIMTIRPTKLQKTPFIQTAEDSRRLLHLDEIIEMLQKLKDHYWKEYNAPGFVCDVMFLCKTTKKNRSRRRTRIPRGLRHEVFKRDNYTCVECGAKKSDGATLHVDHKIPVSKGGTDELSNLQTLCSDCNLNKSDVIQ